MTAIGRGSAAGAFVVAGILASASIAAPATAQVNIEAQRRAPSELGLSGTAAADLLLKTGNVEDFRLGVSGRVDYLTRSTSTRRGFAAPDSRAA